MPRVEDSLLSYQECCNSFVGRLQWPEPRIEDNSLFIRIMFRAIELYKDEPEVIDGGTAGN
jgi:hypothetical protein